MSLFGSLFGGIRFTNPFTGQTSELSPGCGCLLVIIALLLCALL